MRAARTAGPAVLGIPFPLSLAPRRGVARLRLKNVEVRMRTMRLVARGIALVCILLLLVFAALLVLLAYPFQAMFRDDD